MQLRAWELAEHTDEEAKIFVDAIPGRDSRSTHSADENSLEDTKIDRTGMEAVPNLDDMNLEDVAAMASFAAPTSSAKARIVAPFLGTLWRRGIIDDSSAIYRRSSSGKLVGTPQGFRA